MKTQKELKELYTEELKKAWHDDKMVKFCSKNTAYIIEYDGRLYGIDKPSIKTSFCFGHGFCGISTEDDEQNAINMARVAATKESYFIAENLKQIDEWIKDLTEIKENMSLNWAEGSYPRYMVSIGKHYTGQTEDCILNYFSIRDNGWQKPTTQTADIALIDLIITGYGEVRKDFEKRINTYLKRYGLTKINSWSYLVD